MATVKVLYPLARVSLIATVVLLIAQPARAAPPGGAPSSPADAPNPADESSDGEDDEDDEQWTIVQIDRDVAYFDLGDSPSIAPGATLRVLRTVSAKHPVSGKLLVDHFPLGKIVVDEVSEVLSRGRLEKRIAGAVRIGDVIRAPIAKPSRPAPGATPRRTAADPAASPQPAPPPAVPPEAQALSRVFEMTLGRTPGQRALLLSEYLSAHPTSPYAAALQAEIAVHRRWEEAFQAAARRPPAPAPDPRSAATQAAAAQQRSRERLTIRAALPDRVTAGDPIEVALTTRDPSAARAAFAYVRRPEENTYERVTLQPDGDGYFRGALAVAVSAPPSLEVFLEVIGADGERGAYGTSLAPHEIIVDPAPAPPQTGPRGRSEIRGFFEYVDFYRFKGNDYYLLSEGDFTYRPGGWLAGVSTGFGVLHGRGGRNENLQRLKDTAVCASAPVPPECGAAAGFNYGYFEMELRFGKWVSAAPRLLIGQTVSGPGAGGELKLRIGQVTGTNLQLAASYFQNFGARGSLLLEWNVIRSWPMGGAVIVTNEPAQGDVGVRIIYQIAYRARPWLQPALRVGVAARNIEQIGLNLGLGLITAW